MRTLTNIALALGAASALALGSAAFAQDSAKPEAAKPEAATPESAQKHRHGHDKSPMRGMRGGCQGESRGEHNHS